MTPGDIAKQIINHTLEEGAKTHNGEAWLGEPIDKHLDKAVRHIMTFKLMRDGHQLPDSENHLHNALTRIAMAIGVSNGVHNQEDC